MKSKMLKIVVAGVALGALTLVSAAAVASSVDSFGGKDGGVAFAGGDGGKIVNLTGGDGGKIEGRDGDGGKIENLTGGDGGKIEFLGGDGGKIENLAGGDGGKIEGHDGGH